MTGEKHIADVKTSSDVVLEFQHSPLTEVEREAREAFHSRMLWIVDARGFADDLRLGAELPDPDSALAADLVIQPAPKSWMGLDYWSRSFQEKWGGPIRPESLGFIKEEIRSVYNGYHAFHWRRPIRTWLEARCPVFLDIGSADLLRLRGDHPSLQGIVAQKVSACDLIERNGGTYRSLGQVALLD